MNTISSPYLLHHESERLTLFTRFMNWCAAQDHNRYGWLAVILTLHGCILAPISVMIVLTTGIGFLYVPVIIGAMSACVVSNLAAMPTRATIPIFFASLLVDMVIIAIAIISLF